MRLKIPIYDSLCFDLGGCRVLIFGGNINIKTKNEKFAMYDLTCECIVPPKVGLNGGDFFIPVVFEQNLNNLNIFQGMPSEDELGHQELKMSPFICTCRAVDISYGKFPIQESARLFDKPKKDDL